MGRMTSHIYIYILWKIKNIPIHQPAMDCAIHLSRNVGLCSAKVAASSFFVDKSQSNDFLQGRLTNKSYSNWLGQ